MSTKFSMPKFSMMSLKVLLIDLAPSSSNKLCVQEEEQQTENDLLKLCETSERNMGCDEV